MSLRPFVDPQVSLLNDERLYSIREFNVIDLAEVKTSHREDI